MNRLTKFITQNPDFLVCFRSIILTGMAVLLMQVSWGQTYCEPQRDVHGGPTELKVDLLEEVSLLSLSNTTTRTKAYSYYDNTSEFPAPSLEAGSTYSMTVKGQGGGKHTAVVWIDFDDSGENGFTHIASHSEANAGTFIFDITIPGTAAPGNHRMRVLWQYNDGADNKYNNDPCTTDAWGQTEDYLIEIIGCPPVQPNCPTLTSPANNQTGITRCGMMLTWNKSNNIDCTQDLEYDIYLGTTTNPLFFATVSENYYSPVLNGNTTYYWRVVAKNAEGTSSSCTQRSFRTNNTCNTGPGGVVSNLRSWFKADQQTTLADGNVSRWNSTVGSYDVRQGTSNKRPSYFAANNPKALGTNFNAGIHFDGVNDELTSSSAGNILGTTGTVFVSSKFIDGITVFASNANKVNYQMKDENTGYSPGTPQNSPNNWQRGFDQLPALAYTSEKMKVSYMMGGSWASTNIGRNGNVEAGNQWNPTFGAIVYSELALGARGGDEFSNSIITEVITYNRQLTAVEIHRINSYLAIKYGVTLGTNGVGMNYNDSGNGIIWSQSSNSVYAYDIAGIGRDELTLLDQRKSHSINGSDGTPGAEVFSDILTIANGIDFNNPASFSGDRSFLIWGHNNGAIENLFWPHINYPVTNLAGHTSEIIESILDRKWKAQETGVVGAVKLEFDMSRIPGVEGLGDNNLPDVRLLVDVDGNFTSGAFSISPTSYNATTKIVYFNHDFSAETGFYFTIGSVNYKDAPLPIELSEFKAECSDHLMISWTTETETNSSEFIVDKSRNGSDWIKVQSVDAAGNSNQAIDYKVIDKTPWEDITYYRLRQVDYDGKENVYGPISVACESIENDLRIYPNPNGGEFTIEIKSSENIEGAIIYIVDNMGREIEVIRANIQKGINLIYYDDFHLSRGSYVIHLREIKGVFNPVKILVK